MIIEKTSRLAVTPRVILEGVPRVGFYMGGERCPEDVPFPSCLRACLDYFGEDLGYRLISEHDTTWKLDNTFTVLMGVSGCAFRLSWGPGWHDDNGDITTISDDPEAPFQRAFEAAGYEVKIIDAGEDPASEWLYRDAIVRSLGEEGRPVIAFGVIGPPEACLITGYEGHANVLIGWNFFQDFPEFSARVEREPTGEFRKRDWFAATRRLLVFGEKHPCLPRGTLYRKALRWALQVMRAKDTGVDPVTSGELRNGERHNGSAAYQAWAVALLQDADFHSPADCANPPDWHNPMDALRERFLVHDEAVGTVAEGRWYAARFMELIADAEPAMEEDLMAACACFDDEHDLMWQIWGLAGGNGRSDDHVRRLADPDVRRAIAPLILRAREKDIQAADFIERALKE